MIIKKWLFNLLFIFVFITSEFAVAEQPLLQKRDVQEIMQEILSQHVDKKGMTEEILRNSFALYIDQFDPDRLYFIDVETTPFLSLTPDALNQMMERYEMGDFEAYQALNLAIQKSIHRAREYRHELMKEKEWLFYADPSEYQELMWRDSNLKLPFAKTDYELKGRIRQDMLAFIDREKRRYGDEKIMRNKDHVMKMYEAQMRNLEDQYLFVDQYGRPLPNEEQENLFVMFVIKSLAKSLDSHTTFLDPNEAQEMRVRLEKGFRGIGVVLKKDKNGIIISDLIEGSPAEKSGEITVNDRILEVNKEPISSYTLAEVIRLIRQNANGMVHLKIHREIDDEKIGPIEKTLDVKLKPAIIALDEDRVDTSFETFGNGVIGKITLHSFYQGGGITSEKDVARAIKKLEENNLRGLILDLRENSGGFLTQAVKVAGLFISSGVVVTSKYADGEAHVYRDMDAKIAFDGPLIVLTSKATASAAEIVAQALQDYGVAVVVGDEQTYGKGTIQSQTVTGNKSASFFKVTVGKFYTVSGKTPQVRGVKSDIIVPSQFTHEEIGEEYLQYTVENDTIPASYEDRLEDIDPNLRSWYLRYYIPTMQHPKVAWKQMVPVLQKNSAFRIENNKDYQLFLDGKRYYIDGYGSHREHGVNDLQMKEAVNIVKDMILMQSKMSDEQKKQKRKGRFRHAGLSR